MLNKKGQRDSKQVESVKDLDFSPKMAGRTYIMVLMINLVVNIDHGVLPGGLNVIPDELGLKET